jgi:hypothetical protein
MPEDDIGPYKRHELLTGEIYYPVRVGTSKASS